MKGFAIVEFETRDQLIEALGKNEDTFKNRKLRVDLAENNGKEGKEGKKKMKTEEEDQARRPRQRTKTEDKCQENEKTSY